jgi:hypothetical protein
MNASSDYVARELRTILVRIEMFHKQCAKESYTDTDEAWSLLGAIAADARRALKQLKGTE